MVKGTSRMRASVCASKVLPDPVGPISRIFDFASSTSVVLGLVIEPLVVIVDGDREHLLGVVLPDHIVVENLRISSGWESRRATSPARICFPHG
jgi:hypothetical protein